MRNIRRTGIAIGIICVFLCGCVSLNKRSLEINDVIVFLGDSITQEGVRPDGYVTLTSQVIGEKTDGTNEFDKMLEEYSNISRKLARVNGSQLLDLREDFMAYLKEHNSDNVASGILTRDMVHLNKQGNIFLSHLVLEALNVPYDD